MKQITMVTLKEVLRKRIILLIGAGTILFLIIYGVILRISYNTLQDGKLFMKSAVYISALGLYFSNMITAFMAILSSVGAVSSEIESGILHSVITRPLKRYEYIIGKYLGLAIMLTAYSVILYLSVFLLSMLLNAPSVQDIDLTKIFRGMLLFLLQPLILLTLCIYGSVSFKTLNNGIFAIFIYILGLLGGVLEQVGVMFDNGLLNQWGILISLISPFDVIYRKMVSVLYGSIGLTNPVMPGASLMPSTLPSSWMLVYIIIYAFLLLLFAVKKFNRKNI